MQSLAYLTICKKQLLSTFFYQLSSLKYLLQVEEIFVLKGDNFKD